MESVKLNKYLLATSGRKQIVEKYNDRSDLIILQNIYLKKDNINKKIMTNNIKNMNLLI